MNRIQRFDSKLNSTVASKAPSSRYSELKTLKILENFFKNTLLSTTTWKPIFIHRISFKFQTNQTQRFNIELNSTIALRPSFPPRLGQSCALKHALATFPHERRTISS